MENTIKVLWLILARSGSKSIPDKNIKLLGGIPLLVYRIKSALAIADKEDVWISTDSEYYAKIAQEYGAAAPFLRPPELAGDTSRSEDAVLHAVQWAESKGRIYDALCILEPTSPFIKPLQLRQAVDMLFKDREAHSVVAVREVRPNTFFVQDEDAYLTAFANNLKTRTSNIRRQDFKKQITPSGGFYMSKWEIFKDKKSVYSEKTIPFIVPDINGLEIDEPMDWLWAEFLIEKKIIDISEYFTIEG